MCLLSLFGCFKKEMFILDGPGMAREVTWTEFTFSQQSDVYEQNYSLTVKRHAETDDFYLYVYTIATGGDEPNAIKLKDKTVSQLYNMNFLALSEEEPNPLEGEILDGSFSSFQVIDENGTEYKKALPYAMENELKQLLLPYCEW